MDHWSHASSVIGASADGRRAPALEAGRRSSAAFTMRRAQVPLASALGAHTPAIAATLGRSDQTVRNAIRAARGRVGADARLASPPGPSTPPSIPPRGTAARPAPPRSARLRPPDQPLDVGLGRRNGAHRGADCPTGDRRDGAGHPGPPRGAVAAGQTPDHRPRPGIRPKKRMRDRLIRLARTHPDWARGFADAVRWSRVAPPAVPAGCPLGDGDRHPLRLA
jgi:hypothetical protein